LYQNARVKTAAIIGDVGSGLFRRMKQYFIETSRNWAEPSPVPGDSVAVMWTSVPSSREVKAKAPQALAMPYFLQGNGAHHQAGGGAGFLPVFIGGDGYSPNMYEIAGDAWKDPGGSPTSIYDDPVLQARSGEVPKAVTARMPRRSATWFSAYDIIYWIADAIRRAGKAEGPPCGIHGEHQGSQADAFHPHPRTEDTQSSQQPTAILQFRKGKPVYVENGSPRYRSERRPVRCLPRHGRGRHRNCFSPSACSVLGKNSCDVFPMRLSWNGFCGASEKNEAPAEPFSDEAPTAERAMAVVRRAVAEAKRKRTTEGWTRTRRKKPAAEKEKKTRACERASGHLDEDLPEDGGDFV
jgi:hypothetical protein